MFIYTYTDWTASVEGEVPRKVVCEHCGRQFTYIIRCEGVGTGHSPYRLADKQAQRKAQERAKKHLAKQLDTAQVPMPCPSCGQYQAAMVDELKRTKHPLWLHVPRIGFGVDVGVWLLAALGVIAHVIGMPGLAANPLIFGSVFLLPLTLLYSARLGFFMWHLFGRQRFDPYRGTSAEERIDYARSACFDSSPQTPAEGDITPTIYD